MNPFLDVNIENLLKKYGFEKVEKDPINNATTGYPKPLKRFKLIYSSSQNNLENHYYLILNFIERVLQYPEIEKIIDVYTSGTLSDVFGNAMQRLGAQQDRASNLMATIGRLVIDLMKTIHELRKIDERLGYIKSFDQGNQAADVALKGIWSDNVDSQSKTEASIITLSQKAGFSALPDLFFRTYVKDESEIDKVVNNYDISIPLKSVLKRKLMNFLRWKKEIKRELEVRRKVLLRLIQHHYNSIKLYAYWLRPYLLNIKHLQMNTQYSNSPHIINSFNTNVSEIEILAKKKVGNKYACLLINFFYRTNPLIMTGKEYSKYPIHVGTLEITFRAYSWTEKEIENYKKMRDEETLSLVYEIGENIQETLKNIGEDFEKYLKEAEELNKKESKEKKDEKSKDINEIDDFGIKEIFEPFEMLLDGFKELFQIFFPQQEKNKSNNDDKKPEDILNSHLWKLYNTYKKVNRFFTV